jgi:hypothetical protein
MAMSNTTDPLVGVEIALHLIKEDVPIHREVKFLRRGSLQAQPVMLQRPTGDARLEIQVCPGLDVPLMIRERKYLVLLRLRPILPAEILSLQRPVRIAPHKPCMRGDAPNVTIQLKFNQIIPIPW